MKNKIDYFLFALYLLGIVIYLQKEVLLQHEWQLIMNDFAVGNNYRMYGIPTAYMPPFYSYYLLLCQKLFGFSIWIKASCIIQSIIYFFSLYYLFIVFLGEHFSKWGTKLLFCSLLFFPPLFIGNVSVSSFSLSVSIMNVFFALLFVISKENCFGRRKVIYLALISIAGLYIRFEFIFIIFLAGLIFLYLRKIDLSKFIKIILFVFVAYLPWTIRNYVEIGKFTYATSLNYNFAKGNSTSYNILSSYNVPFDPVSQELLPINVLYKKFENEKKIDDYLSTLNNNFIKENPQLLIKLTVQKLAVNFFQYFPDYNGLSKHQLYVFYSMFFVIFQACLLLVIVHLKRRKQKYLYTFTLCFYMFFLLFYVIAPMPRYLLLYYPVFLVIIGSAFIGSNIFNNPFKQKKIAS